MGGKAAKSNASPTTASTGANAASCRFGLPTPLVGAARCASYGCSPPDRIKVGRNRDKAVGPVLLSVHTSGLPTSPPSEPAGFPPSTVSCWSCRALGNDTRIVRSTQRRSVHAKRQAGGTCNQPDRARRRESERECRIKSWCSGRLRSHGMPTLRWVGCGAYGRGDITVRRILVPVVTER